MKAIIRKNILFAAKLLAATLLVLGIYFFIKQHPWQSHGWRGIGWSYLYFVCFVSLGIALLKWIKPVNVPSTRYGRMAFGLLAAGMVFLFVVKYLQNIDCIPVVLCSESDNASVSSMMIWNKLSGGSLVPPKGYNLGMGYLYLPLYAIWGKSIWATKILYVVCWTLAMLAIAAIWWREYRHEGLLSILLVISTLSYGLAIERRYKWHIVSVLLVTAVFWVVSRMEHRKRWYHYPLLGIVMAAGIVGYHGCLVYLVFVALYFLSKVWLRPGTVWLSGLKRWFVPILAISALGLVLYLCRSFLSDRMLLRFRFVYGGTGGIAGPLQRHLITFLNIFFGQISFITSVAFVVGLGSVCIDFRKSWIARFAIIGFGLISVSLLVFYGFDNLDESSFIIVFIYLVMAYGIYSILSRLHTNLLRVLAVAVFAFFMAWQESALYRERYLNYTCVQIHPNNPTTQGFLALYDVSLTENPFISRVFFPAPKLKGNDGGFGHLVHRSVLPMREYAEWRGKLRYFKSLGALRIDVMKQMKKGKRDPGRIVAYVSHNVGRKTIDRSLQGLTWKMQEVSYFEREWRKKIPVYKLTFTGISAPLRKEPVKVVSVDRILHLKEGRRTGSLIKTSPGEAQYIADDEDPQFKIVSGRWRRGRDSGRDCYGDLVHWGPASVEFAEARWTVEIPVTGDYEVFARWTQYINLATDTPYTVQHAEGVDTVRVNQQENGGKWNSLGVYRFSEDSPAVISISNDANNYVIADAVKLEYRGELPPRAKKPVPPVNQIPEEPEEGIIADDEDPQFKIVSGAWGHGRESGRGCYGDLVHWAPGGVECAEARWTVEIPVTGDYEVFARWTQYINRATDTPYTVQHAGGTDTVRVNQQENGGKWNSLGVYRFSEDSPAVISISNDADNYVIADAVKLIPR